MHESLVEDTPASAPRACDCGVVELRQYTLRPGRRDDLVALFDREFVETQEAVGIRVIGQFRDLDAPDRFVWLRGFADMATRWRGLEAFYGGPAWAAHRLAANATMIDVDDVRLLRPAWAGAGIEAPGSNRAPRGTTKPSSGRLLALVLPLRAPACDEPLSVCRVAGTQALLRAGARKLGWYVTEPAANDFPRLPVREGEYVIVALALLENDAALAAFVDGQAWEREVDALLRPWLSGPAHRLRLAPTPRSALRAHPPPLGG